MNKTQILTSTSDKEFTTDAGQFIFDLIVNRKQKETVISLSGGKTPYPIYKYLIAPIKKAGLQNKLFFIQTDERNLSSDSDRSNQKTIKECLFSNEGLPAEIFYPIVPLKSDYLEVRNICVSNLPEHLGPPDPIDILILGMGDDGHTASLFPDTSWLKPHTDTGYELFKSQNQPEERISLTMNQIIKAENIVFLVSGNKENAIKEVLLNKNSRLPAGYVLNNCKTTWFLDPQASEIYKTLRSDRPI
ncbi:MAG: 6-phosphogluconolactonase [Candidatus Rifleibacteriota bacterium]